MGEILLRGGERGGAFPMNITTTFGAPTLVDSKTAPDCASSLSVINIQHNMILVLDSQQEAAFPPSLYVLLKRVFLPSQTFNQGLGYKAFIKMAVVRCVSIFICR